MEIYVITHPNNKRPRVEKDLTGTLHVYVREPPLDGKANTAAIKALADYFHVKKHAVSLRSGHTSKHKRFGISIG